MWNYQLFRLAKGMGWEGILRKQGMLWFQKFVEAFLASDASLLEINPLVLTAENELLALDAKCSIDDNALYRHPDLKEMQDLSQLSPREALASRIDLAYVELDGTIGCIVNGAGLAMATMDLLYLFGGKPANFLDVGGGASLEKITEGFELLLSDERLEVIFVNIFGGIMDCKLLAEGILAASKRQSRKIPLVIRMDGTSAEEGRRLLKNSSLQIDNVSSMEEGAKKACERGKKWQS